MKVSPSLALLISSRMARNTTRATTFMFSRSMRLSASTDGYLRRCSRLARALHGETQDQLLYRLLARALARLSETARARGLDPIAMSRADYDDSAPCPVIPPKPMPSVDEIGPSQG